MAMKYLIDTNIILEILLQQEKAEKCKTFLFENFNDCSISDFSLHSIGVLLFRFKKSLVFNQFIFELAEKLSVLSVSVERLGFLSHWNALYNLDFDDAYQADIAEENNLVLITLDKDFKKTVGKIKVNFFDEIV